MPMTYSIRNVLLFLSLIVIFEGCLSSGLSQEEYFELCPYETKSGRFFQLQTDLDVTPHQKTYQVGDTMVWRVSSTDSIFDFNRDLSFLIENFPFQPFFHLYRIDGNSWTSGFDHMDVLIDSVYAPRFVTGGSTFARSLRGTATYIDGNYLFEFRTVLRDPGVYVNYVVDKTWGFGPEDVKDGLVPEYDSIINSSGCPGPIEYFVDFLLQGDPRFDDFQDEMSFMDKEIYFDNMARKDGVDADIWGRQGGSIVLEWRGVFGFEVVE